MACEAIAMALLCLCYRDNLKDEEIARVRQKRMQERAKFQMGRPTPMATLIAEAIPVAHPVSMSTAIGPYGPRPSGPPPVVPPRPSLKHFSLARPSAEIVRPTTPSPDEV